ncbi:MAG TPA: hypothetical protein VML00_04240, partial [Bacteroidota bacterium]|nr:hypothetical protein [Bacteroidota bacterium]
RWGANYLLCPWRRMRHRRVREKSGNYQPSVHYWPSFSAVIASEARFFRPAKGGTEQSDQEPVIASAFCEAISGALDRRVAGKRSTQ